jgi:hypothetical protein
MGTIEHILAGSIIIIPVQIPWLISYKPSEGKLDLLVKFDIIKEKFEFRNRSSKDVSIFNN